MKCSVIVFYTMSTQRDAVTASPDNLKAFQRGPERFEVVGQVYARFGRRGTRRCYEVSNAQGREGPPLWKVEHRFIVRGHWRNQAVGPGRAERRKTWIAPHWKGPEGAEAWRHIYKAGPIERVKRALAKAGVS